MTETEYKYYCDKCKFGAQYKSIFDQHCETTIHKTGKRKERSNKKPKLKCSKCPYEAKLERSIILHTLNKHGTKEEREKGFTHYCKECDFGTFIEELYQNHCNTIKHKRRIGKL